MGLAIKIQVVSATDVGGQYPFVVVCFDGDINNELYKTDATTGGKQAVWNHEFALDLTSNIKAVIAEGKPEPTYLTFFIFDTGAPGTPSLGSAGVLLATVRDTGRAQGDFPVVNGNGTLRLVVTTEKTKRGMDRFSTGQKIAGVAGVGALAAGITALAVNQHKKKKGKKSKTTPTGTRGIGGGESSDENHPEGEEATRSRPWWAGSESSSSSSDEEEAEGGHAEQEYPQAREVAHEAYEESEDGAHEEYGGGEGGDA